MEADSPASSGRSGRGASRYECDDCDLDESEEYHCVCCGEELEMSNDDDEGISALGWLVFIVAGTVAALIILGPDGFMVVTVPV